MEAGVPNTWRKRGARSSPGANANVVLPSCSSVNPIRGWLGPARDFLAFTVYVASFFVDVVSWQGQRYKVGIDGTLVPVGEPKA